MAVYSKLKFYKYYDLNNPYALQNIKEHIIHFSLPESFNDPFDCFMGYNEESTIELFLLSIWLRLCENGDVSDWSAEAVTKFIYSEKLSKDEKNYLNGYIKKWADEEEWAPFNVEYWTKKSAYERGKLLFHLWGVKENESLEILKRMRKLHLNIKEIINQKYGVSCFSESFDNQLMWAHYADKHRGVCVEYDFAKLDPSDLMLQFFCPVEYTKKRLTVPVDIETNETFVTKIKEGNYDYHFAAKVLLTKADFWKYEHEWRVVMSLTDLDQSNNLYKKIISAIYLGVNISPERKEAIKLIGKENRIPVYQMSIRSDDFKFDHPILVS